MVLPPVEFRWVEAQMVVHVGHLAYQVNMRDLTAKVGALTIQTDDSRKE